MPSSVDDLCSTIAPWRLNLDLYNSRWVFQRKPTMDGSMIWIYSPTSNSGKWRFIGIPYWKCDNPGGDCHPGWEVDLNDVELTRSLLGRGFKYFCIFTPIWGRWTHFDHYFFRWVGSSTNQFALETRLLPFAATARHMGSWQSLVWINVATLMGTVLLFATKF